MARLTSGSSVVVAMSIAVLSSSTALGQTTDPSPVRQNVYAPQQAYPSYPAQYNNGGYPQQYGYGYPPPPYGYGGYPPQYGYGYPQPYQQYPQLDVQQQGLAGQSVMRDPATGEVLSAAPAGGKNGTNIEVDPAVRLRGQTPTANGPQSPPGSGLGGQGPARDQMMRRTARVAGIRDGYAQEAQRINTSLTNRAAWLDQHYPFPDLMVSNYVVPPVIILTGNRVERNGPRTLDLSMGRFEIMSDARVTAQPPTWRTYLFMQSDPDNNVAVSPRTPADEKAWSAGYADGQASGIAEARASFEVNVRRMRRDYEGMLRYHDLARSGAVSMPQAISSGKALAVHPNGRVALVGMKRIQLVVTPRFRPSAGPSAFPVGRNDVTMRRQMVGKNP